MIKYAHIRPNMDPRSGGYTIAFERINDRVVNAAIARCNPKDNFNKKLGRQIAKGRLEKGQSEVLPTRATRFRNIVKAIVTHADKAIATEKLLYQHQK